MRWVLAAALLGGGWSARGQVNQTVTGNTNTNTGANYNQNNNYNQQNYGNYGNNYNQQNYGNYGNSGYGSNSFGNSGYGSNSFGNSNYGSGGFGSGGFGSGGFGSGGYGSGGYGSGGFGSGGFGSGGFGSGGFGSRSNYNNNSDNGNTGNGSKSRNNRRNSKDSKTGKDGTKQTAPGQAQNTRSMGKGNVAQRKGGGTEKGGGGRTIELPQVKIDPKVIEDALFMAPSFANLSTGDRFITTLIYFNSARHKVNGADLWLRYDPAVLQPMWADTSAITTETKGRVESEVWADRGMIHIKAKFAVPPKGSSVELADLHWRALAPAVGARIELTAPQGESVAVYEGKTNLVAGDKRYNTQKVNAEINITPQDWEEGGLRTVAQVNAMMKPAPLGKAERLRLALMAPQAEVATGEVGTADVVLLNPSKLAFDDLKLRIHYDPQAVTILDADQDNYIADGVNIFDGDFHEQFPFDSNIRNQVNPMTGTIEYQVCSSMGPRVYPSGTFARIVYRMKRQAGKAVFWFEVDDPSLKVRVTDVAAAGRSLLGEDAAVANEALHGVAVAVKILDLKDFLKPERQNATLAEAK